MAPGNNVGPRDGAFTRLKPLGRLAGPWCGHNADTAAAVRPAAGWGTRARGPLCGLSGDLHPTLNNRADSQAGAGPRVVRLESAPYEQMKAGRWLGREMGWRGASGQGGKRLPPRAASGASIGLGLIRGSREVWLTPSLLLGALPWGSRGSWEPGARSRCLSAIRASLCLPTPGAANETGATLRPSKAQRQA